MAKWDPAKDVHWALAPEFMTPIADALWKVQAKVAKHVQPHEGDNTWVAGCTAYARRCNVLEKMAEKGDVTGFWAGFVDNHFTVRSHGFPIRIYRAPDEREESEDGEVAVPERYATCTQTELDLLGDALELPLEKLPAFLYRIEVVTRHLGKPVAIRLVEVNSVGNISNVFDIPVSAEAKREVEKRTDDLSISPIRQRKAPVVPPLADVKPKKVAERKQNREGDRGESSA